MIPLCLCTRSICLLKPHDTSELLGVNHGESSEKYVIHKTILDKEGTAKWAGYVACVNLVLYVGKRLLVFLSNLGCLG